MNDSFRTNVFVQYHPETIACACIYLAARQLQVPLPNSPPWFNIFDVTEDEINDICLGILKLYARPKPNPDKLEALVNSTKKIHIEAKLKAKGLSSAGATPNSGSRPETPVKLGTSPLTLPNLKKIKSEDDKGSDSSTGREYGNHVSKRRRSRSRSHSRSRSASHSRSPSPRRSKSRSYSSRSRSRSASRSPVEKRKYRDAESPPRKWKKNSHIKEYRDTYKDYKEDYYVSSKEKSRSRKHRRSTSYSPSRSRSYSRSPLPRKTHKKHVKERYRSRSRTPDRYSKVDKYDRSRSRDRLMRSKKRNGHHRSRSRERYRR